MLRSYWVAIAAVGLIAAASGVAVQYVDYAEREQPTPQQPYSSPTKPRANIARVADAVESIAADQRSTGEEERSRRDLDANEGQERWARWAAWAGLVQLVLSGGGIILVLQSLRQSDRALREARRANRITLLEAKRSRRESKEGADHTAQTLSASKRNADAAAAQVEMSADVTYRELRAYVTATSLQVFVSKKDNLTEFRVEAMLHNSGKTTAYITTQSIKFVSEIGNGRHSAASPRVINPGAYATYQLRFGVGSNHARPLNTHARCFVEYRDYRGAMHSEDSFWAHDKIIVPDSGIKAVAYDLDCHSQIDETIGRFIDPKGEEADRKKLEETIARVMRESGQPNG